MSTTLKISTDLCPVYLELQASAEMNALNALNEPKWLRTKQAKHSETNSTLI